MNKSELIERVAEKLKVSRNKTESVVDLMFDAMTEALKTGERIELRGLGTFEVRDYGSYVGRNPKTGESISVKPKKLPFFKVGKELKERVNG